MVPQWKTGSRPNAKSMPRATHNKMRRVEMNCSESSSRNRLREGDRRRCPSGADWHQDCVDLAVAEDIMANARGAMATGLGLGAGLMYFLDPERGARPRAGVRDRIAHARNRTSDAVGCHRTGHCASHVRSRCTVENVFRFWTSCENFPRFMSHVLDVRPSTRERQSHWAVTGPAGAPAEFDAEVSAFCAERGLRMANDRGIVRGACRPGAVRTGGRRRDAGSDSHVVQPARRLARARRGGDLRG